MLRAWRSRRWLRDPEAARAWLFRIAANIWRDQLRRQRSALGRTVPLSPEVAARVPPAEQQAAANEDLRLALDALEQLPDAQRQAIYLRTCENLSAAEVAAVLHTTADSVKANLCAARKKLREQLKRVLDTLTILL